MKKHFLTVLFVLIFFRIGFAETYIPLSSDIYNQLRRLEGLGYIKTGQLTTLPLSVSEVKRLVKEAKEEGKKDQVAVNIIKRIERYLPEKEFDMSAEFDYKYYEDSFSILANKNNYGIRLEEGSNLKIGGEFLYSPKEFGVFASPYFLSNDSYEKVSFGELYTVFNYNKIEFSLGKQNQWWGGGQNGSILLSNNAEGLNVFKISNSTPIEFLVPFRFSFFIAKLEHNRTDVKSPYINGIRLTLKPSRYLEIGLSKTALYGGRGRKNDIGTFLDSLIGNKEKNTTDDFNREPGDQRAGFDFKLLVPNSIQPFTFYIEAIAEDVSDDFPYPYKYAFIYSLYLPKFLNNDKIELLIEHADTVFRQKNLWYNHHIFTQGYTYNGEIIGHYIGSDAKDWFAKIRYNTNSGYFALSYEKLKKTLINKVYEAYGIGLNQDVIDHLSLNLGAMFLKEEKDRMLVSVGVRYEF